jgi:hypothetical protein
MSTLQNSSFRSGKGKRPHDDSSASHYNHSKTKKKSYGSGGNGSGGSRGGGGGNGNSTKINKPSVLDAFRSPKIFVTPSSALVHIDWDLSPPPSPPPETATASMDIDNNDDLISIATPTTTTHEEEFKQWMSSPLPSPPYTPTKQKPVVITTATKLSGQKPVAAAATKPKHPLVFSKPIAFVQKSLMSSSSLNQNAPTTTTTSAITPIVPPSSYATLQANPIQSPKLLTPKLAPKVVTTTTTSQSISPPSTLLPNLQPPTTQQSYQSDPHFLFTPYVNTKSAEIVESAVKHFSSSTKQQPYVIHIEGVTGSGRGSLVHDIMCKIKSKLALDDKTRFIPYEFNPSTLKLSAELILDTLDKIRMTAAVAAATSAPTALLRSSSKKRLVSCVIQLFNLDVLFSIIPKILSLDEMDTLKETIQDICSTKRALVFITTTSSNSSYVLRSEIKQINPQGLIKRLVLPSLEQRIQWLKTTTDNVDLDEEWYDICRENGWEYLAGRQLRYDLVLQLAARYRAYKEAGDLVEIPSSMSQWLAVLNWYATSSSIPRGLPFFKSAKASTHSSKSSVSINTAKQAVHETEYYSYAPFFTDRVFGDIYRWTRSSTATINKKNQLETRSKWWSTVLENMSPKTVLLQTTSALLSSSPHNTSLTITTTGTHSSNTVLPCKFFEDVATLDVMSSTFWRGGSDAETYADYVQSVLDGNMYRMFERDSDCNSSSNNNKNKWTQAPKVSWWQEPSTVIPDLPDNYVYQGVFSTISPNDCDLLKLPLDDKRGSSSKKSSSNKLSK